MNKMTTHGVRIFFAWLLLLLPLSQAVAEQGLLWHITGKGANSYLFGTMHSDDPRVTQLPGLVERRFAEADTLMLELNLDAETQMLVALEMMLPAGRSLSAIVGSKLGKRSQEAMLSRGIPVEMTERFQPWAIVITLSMPKQMTGEFLDLQLYRRSQQRGMQFRALETAEEQLAVFKSLSDSEQTQLLRHVLSEYETYPAMFEAMTEAYIREDLQQLKTISDSASLSGDTALQERFMAHLLDQRNWRMVERIVPMLKKEKLFIGVGALHLAGENGLITLLREQGYTVETAR